MPIPAEPLIQDAVGGDASLQHDTMLFDRRRQERSTEEKLRKAMHRYILQEWLAWLALFIGLLTVFQAHLGSGPWIVGLTALSSVMTLIGAIDSANAKRTQAILAWIEYQREKKRGKDHF